MKLRRRLKAVLAEVLVTLALVIPFALTIGAPAAIPTLYFDGMRLKVCDDGAVQLFLDVAVEGVNTWGGVTYNLVYDKTLLRPSDFETNAALGTVGTDAFFRLDETLYDPLLPEGPINKSAGVYTSQITNVSDTHGRIVMEMFLDQTRDGDENGRLTLENSKLEIYEPPNLESGFFYVVNTAGTPNDPGKDPHEGGAAHGKTVIGTLSFRADAKDIPAMAALYGGIVEEENPKGKDGTYLIDFPRDGGGVVTTAAWQIHYFNRNGSKVSYSAPVSASAQALFTFGFPDDIISVEPLEKHVAVNAYQAYSDGTEADIPLTLQKFGPMVTVTYASGTRENKIMPWGSAAAAYTVTQHDGTGGGYVPIDAVHPYDPTGVISSAPAEPDYKISQSYVWETPDGAGGTVTHVFPLPVQVTLDVQEIHLLGFASEHLARTYPIDNYLPTLTAGSFGLELPDFARVVTDIPPGNTSMLMPIPGWSSANGNSPNKWPNASTMHQLYEDSSTTGDVHWPTVDDLGTPDPAKHVGTYSFEMAASNGGAAVTFTKAGVAAVFPWLATPPDGNAAYEMPKATRVLTEPANFSDVISYRAAYLSTAEGADSAPVLTLNVARATSADMAADAEFRVLMPDGTEILAAWFAGTSGMYETDYVPSSPSSYNLVFNPGRTDAGGHMTEREALRRLINLGGYFYVAVNEDTSAKTWSDFMPVYVPPRENKHLDSVEYNFLGVNARLFHYPGAMSTVVTLPQGFYHPVDEFGTPYYNDAAGDKTAAPTVFGLYEEQFGAQTTYDGLTGAQPGRLYTFAVEGNPGAWPAATGETPIPGMTYDRYGPDSFVDGRAYGGYGKVANPDTQKATVRVQTPRDAALPEEKIKVTYEGGSTSVSMDPGGHLQLARYDNRTAGYTDRQEYEIVILNEGDTDIYDLAVFNSAFDAAIGGGHFIVTRPPAAFLPAGGRTTFTLTYVYGLKANSAADTPGFPLEYLDHLYVTSSSRPRDTLNTGDPSTYLAKFDASFSVKTTAQHRIILNITPPGGEMGTAGVIVGEEKDNPNFPTYWEMNYNLGSNRAERSAVVYFSIKLADQMYAVAAPRGTDAAGNPITVTQYRDDGTGTNGWAALEPGTQVYYFTMPDYDVTIDILFSEPIKSKLRLHDGIVYASPDSVPLGGTGSQMAAYPLYRKRFTAAENPPEPAPVTPGTTLMKVGRAGAEGMSPSVFHYLTVIPYEAEYIQVEVLLRQVLAVVPGNVPVTGLGVTMTLYDSTGTKSTTVFPPSTTAGMFYENWAGQTNPVSPPAPDVYDHHLSNPIKGPDVDKSIYVEITLTSTYPDPVDYNTYYFEIHRQPKSPVVRYDYGNSPYGLIMNAKAGDVTNKTAARDAFIANQYRFGGLAANQIPDVLAGGEFLPVHYWSEAWVKPGKLYEPETGTGMTGLGPPAVYDPAVYDPQENLDLNEYALFVQAGEPFDEPGLLELYDSSGRVVKLWAGQAGLDEEPVTKVACSAEVTILDAAATSIVARYSMPDPADSAEAGAIARRTALLDMGLQGQKGTTNWWAAGAKVQRLSGGVPMTNSGGKVYEPLTGPFDLRPGVYQLVYTCLDFDGKTPLTMTRPLVVLAPIGDVNGTGAVDGGDRNDLRRRVGKPLAYDGAVTFYPNTNLYRFRVCDVNNDRNINNIDANQLGDNPRRQYYLFTGYRPE